MKAPILHAALAAESRHAYHRTTRWATDRFPTLVTTRRESSALKRAAG
ncbi:MAG: hypothetical protein ACKV22_23500 [Bryobacteraceae bacterium]